MMPWTGLSSANQRASETYLDDVFGAGKGEAHRAFLNGFEGTGRFLPIMDAYHALAADQRHLDYETHYLLGVCVLFATGAAQTAKGMVKVLLHQQTSPDRIREAVSRLAFWAGHAAAMEALPLVDQAINEYAEQGLASLPWFALPASAAAPRRTP